MINNNEWMGADVNSTIPLSFETRVNQPMQWRTNNILRMRLNESLPVQPVNNFPSVDLSGHLGIGAPVPAQALSFLHINNNGSFFAGFRPWMRTGVSMSENTDWMYVGAKNEGADRIDAVINWGDNKEADPAFGPDALRFIFTRTPSAINVASRLDGLEIARMIPAPDGNQGYSITKPSQLLPTTGCPKTSLKVPIYPSAGTVLTCKRPMAFLSTIFRPPKEVAPEHYPV